MPPGTKNYLTPDGAQRLQEELERLIKVQRPELAALVDAGEIRRTLQVLDERIRRLRQTIDSALIVQPPARPWDQVRFGATVTVRDASGNESRYRIVGINETDLDRNFVSWCSPVARALLNARIGQSVRFQVPAGEETLEITAITYE
jgi:transcription elongation factor GreB